MALEVLLQTSGPAAEAVVERLERRGIEALVVDRPSWLAWLASFGTYRVRVAVSGEELVAAREELSRWEAEARPRVQALAREVQRALLLASLPAFALGAWLALARSSSRLAWAAVPLLWLVGLAGWGALSRRRARRGA